MEKELSELTAMLLHLNDDVRIVMEATEIYHLPVLTYLKEKGGFVVVVNPFEMKEYRCQGLRKVKLLADMLVLIFPLRKSIALVSLWHGKEQHCNVFLQQ